MANAALIKNAVKELFKADKVALGMIARLGRSGDIARIAKTTGHDFVFVDGHVVSLTETKVMAEVYAKGDF